VAKQQNRDASVGSWGLCYDVGLVILNDRTLGDKSGEFICLANGECSIVDYVFGSPVIWQAITHPEVLIDDTCYYAMGGDSNHMPLNLWLSIDCTFVEPQHTIITKKLLPMFKYDKSKAEKYQLA
jgi:hypothetical protein